MPAPRPPLTSWRFTMTDSPSFLSIESVGFAYPGDCPSLDGVSLSLKRGAFHCLVGRSGCGKTTLLKLAAGLLRPGSGRVCIDGQPLTGPSRQAGFVFQTPSLLEWRTVLDNVLLPVSLHRRVTSRDRVRATDLLAGMGIEDHARRYPWQLSGGQQSRVALARALVTDPPALLLDEPFAALDAITREDLQNDLLRLTRTQGTTVLFVTHDIAEAVYLAGHVSVMENGRITHDLAIDLPGTQTDDKRYHPEFTATCSRIKAALARSDRVGSS